MSQEWDRLHGQGQAEVAERAEKDCLESCWESASTRNELRMKSCQVYVTRLEKLKQVACGVRRVASCALAT